MGSCISYSYANYLFNYFYTNEKNSPDHLWRELVDPKGNIISAEGMYFSFQPIKIHPDGLLDITFKSNLSGEHISLRRHVKLSGFNEYPGCEQDLIRLFSDHHRARLYVEKDKGILYTGKVYIVNDESCFNIVDYLHVLNGLNSADVTAFVAPQDELSTSVRESISYPAIDHKLTNSIESSNTADYKGELNTLRTLPNDPTLDEKIPVTVPAHDDQKDEPNLIDNRLQDQEEISRSLDKLTLIENTF